MKKKYLQITIILSILLVITALSGTPVGTVKFASNTMATPSPTPVSSPQKLPCMMPTPTTRPNAQKQSSSVQETTSDNQEMTFDNVLAIAKSMDEDCDGISDADDNCFGFPSKNLKDSDGDGWGDVCDNISSDISVTMSAKPKQVRVGEKITFTIIVTNHGPVEEAGNIEVKDLFPLALKVNSFTTSNGECDEAEGGLICEAETLAVGRSMTIIVSATAVKAAKLVNTVNVENGIGDLKRANNKATTVNTSVGRIASRK